jgi:hypothetical protein
MLSEKTLVRLLVGIPVLWILSLMSIGFDEQPTISSGKLSDRIKALEAQNNELIAHAAAKHKLEKKLLMASQHEAMQGNQDHPIEEREKAKQQQNIKLRPIQVQAPQQDKEADPDSPGYYFG